MWRRGCVWYWPLCVAVFLCPATAGAGDVTIDSAAAVGQAAARARPGDTLILADPLYEGLRFVFEGQGEKDRPITLRAQTPGQVTITGKSSLVITGEHLVVSGLVFDQAWGGNIIAFSGALRCRLTDCALVECGNPKSTYSHIITMKSGSRKNRIDHCYMQGNLSMGMGVRVSATDFENTDNVFDHNYFKDIVRRWRNGQEAIQVGQGSFSVARAMRARVEFCLFENANGDCEIISNKSSHNTYRYNTFRNCARAELVLRGGSYARVEGNFFLNGLGGVRVHGSHHRVVNNYFEGLRTAIRMACSSANYQPVGHCLVAHNTIVDCRRGFDLGYRKTPEGTPPFENAFLNNIITGKAGTLVRERAARDHTWKGNMAWATGEATLGSKTDGVRIADPGLVSVGGILRLPSTGSPAIDGAVPGPVAVSEDIDGQPRDGRPDVGCDEVSRAPVARRPLEARDVGPTWLKGDPTRIKRIESPKPIPPIVRKK